MDEFFETRMGQRYYEAHDAEDRGGAGAAEPEPEKLVAALNIRPDHRGPAETRTSIIHPGR